MLGLEAQGGQPGFYGAVILEPPLLASKGAAVVLADGISNSAVSGVASVTALANFLEDDHCTANAWNVPAAALRGVEGRSRRAFHGAVNLPHWGCEGLVQAACSNPGGSGGVGRGNGGELR